MSNPAWAWASVGIVVAALAGCGGGGGGGSGLPPTGSAATLTADNYVAAARVAVASSADLIGNLDWVVGVEQAQAKDMLHVVVDHARSGLLRRAASDEWAVGLSSADTELCTYGGSVRYDYSYASESTTTVGDSVTLTFTNCAELEATLNGRMSVTVTAASGNFDGYPYRLGAEITVTNLQSAAAGSSVTANGQMNIEIEGRSSSDEEVRASVSTFDVTGTIASEPYEQRLTAYSLQWRMQPNLMTVATAGRIAGSDLNGGSILVSTPTPIKTQVDWSDYPYEGVVLAEGANASRVRVSALSATAGVLVELDADGNGSYERSETLSWEALLGS